MDLSKSITCPSCGGDKLIAKYEATYVYSYFIDKDALGLKNKEEFLSFLFDNRELKNASQYVECTNCGVQFPFTFGEGAHAVDFTILQKAVRADHAVRPEFLG
jgi:transcription elongation factor Elf1